MTTGAAGASVAGPGGAATVVRGLGLAVTPAPVGVGIPMGPLQALPSAVERGLLPHPLDCVGPGGPKENLPRVPSYAARRALGRGPG